MDSLMDYIQWMGDYPISMTGFHDADALIFCALSYFDLSPLFPSDADRTEISKDTIHESITMSKEDKTIEKRHRLHDCLGVIGEIQLKIVSVGNEESYFKLLTLAASSKRYGELYISDYCELSRKKPPLQFSAICFHDEEDFSFLAYGGTDNSLAGWKENFMISFTRTESQDLAYQYAEKVICTGRRWYVGGHSKGSNLALYASCNLDNERWDAIEHVYLLDGPGLCPEVLDQALTGRVDKKCTQIVPQFCVFGKIFAPQISDIRIVQSSASDILQHSIITWGIDHGKLALAEDFDSVSLSINEAVNIWICQVSYAGRVIFTEELFDALTADGDETIDQIRAKGLEGMEALILRLIQTSDTTKSTLTSLEKQVVKANLNNLRKKITTMFDKVKGSKVNGGQTP